MSVIWNSSKSLESVCLNHIEALWCQLWNITPLFKPSVNNVIAILWFLNHVCGTTVSDYACLVNVLWPRNSVELFI